MSILSSTGEGVGGGLRPGTSPHHREGHKASSPHVIPLDSRALETFLGTASEQCANPSIIQQQWPSAAVSAKGQVARLLRGQ